MTVAVFNVLKCVSFVLLGSFLCTVTCAIAVFFLPIYLYRWVVINLIAPFYRPDIGNAVDHSGQIFATDFITPKTPNKCTIVLNQIFEGNINFEQLLKTIDEKWIKAKLPNGNPQFPELQQYLESWMGFMFWKQDKKFSLKNHTHFHSLDPEISSLDAENFLREFIESLLNRPYPRKQSPWELHVFHNFKSSDLENSKENQTVPQSLIVLRIHHAMVDMYSMFNLVIEKLYGKSFSDVKLAVPSQHPATRPISYITYPLKIYYYIGRLFTTVMQSRESIFYVSDSKKAWHQNYCRGSLISVQKIKKIKTVFSNATFSSVLNSSVSASLSKIYRKKSDEYAEWKSNPAKILLYNPHPKPNHPKPLRNHVRGILFDIPLPADISPLKRLEIVTENEISARAYPYPEVVDMQNAICGNLFAWLLRFLNKNRLCSSGVSNFPGPGIQLTLCQNKLLGMDFAGGLLHGDSGIGFRVLSCVNNIRFCVTAEAAVFSVEDLKEILTYVQEEIDILYELALKAD